MQTGTARSDFRAGRLAAAVVLAGSLVLTSTSQVHAADKETSGVVLTSPNPGELVISWDAASPTPVDYRVMWAPSSGRFLSFRVNNTAEAGNAYPAGTSYTVTGLAEGVEYKVRVRARYGAARAGPWSPLATLEITATEEPPAKPTGVTPGPSHSSVLLEWDDPGDDTITGYQILRGTDADSLAVLVNDTESTDNTYTDASVTAETDYAYAIRARNTGGLSPPSDTATVTTLADPDANEPESALQLTAGDLLAGNLGQSVDPDGHLAGHTGRLNVDQAQGFTTGDHLEGEHTIKGIEVKFKSAPAAGETISASVHARSSGRPGEKLFDLVSPATIVVGDNTFTAPENAVLSANRRYYLVVRAGPSSSMAVLAVTNSDAQDSTSQSGWSIDDGGLYKFRPDTWQSRTRTSSQAKMIRIYATSTSTDNTPPTLQSATVDGQTLVLGYGEALDGTSEPGVTAFSVSVDSGTATAPSSVAVNGSQVTLTLDSAVTFGQSVSVNYTVPTGGAAPIQDLAGNDAASLIGQSVTNNTNAPATGKPAIAGIVQVGTQLRADLSGIVDLNGLDDADYKYTWLRLQGGQETRIGFNSHRYTLTRRDRGKTIKLRVTIIDDHSHTEDLESDETPAVTTGNSLPLTAAPADIVGDYPTLRVGMHVAVNSNVHLLLDDPDGGIKAGDVSHPVWHHYDGDTYTATPIGGHFGTGWSYTVRESDIGMYLVADVTYKDRAGYTQTVRSTLLGPVLPYQSDQGGPIDSSLGLDDFLGCQGRGRTACSMDAPGTINGHIDSTDLDTDYWKVTLEAETRYTISIRGRGDVNRSQPLLQPHLELYRESPTGTRVAEGTDVGDRNSEDMSYTVPADRGGTYYISITTGTALYSKIITYRDKPAYVPLAGAGNLPVGQYRLTVSVQE